MKDLVYLQSPIERYNHILNMFDHAADIQTAPREDSVEEMIRDMEYKFVKENSDELYSELLNNAKVILLNQRAYDLTLEEIKEMEEDILAIGEVKEELDEESSLEETIQNTKIRIEPITCLKKLREHLYGTSQQH
ncbi:hypothetical protein GOV04_04530 [Candidatus Woesearchaeota archaeon]|nr:hypothetical protein [Candidatus Woesearchaeota archaeon]